MSAVAFVVKGYPRLSETFVAQEIAGLEARGLDIRIVSLRRPTDAKRHPVHDEIRAPVLYLPEYLHREPRRVARAWAAARRLPGYARARAAFLRDLRRDPTPNRVRRFGQALVLAAELPADVTRLHAHFLHTPASVTRYAAILLGLPWSASGHAKDVWTTRDWDLKEKLAAADLVATCTEAGRARLAALAPAPGRVLLAYHGIDLCRFPPAPPRRALGPVTIVSVGRAVPKKGYDDLLGALAALPGGSDWRFVHVGGGPLLKELRRQAAALGIAERIEWRGARTQTDVLATLREGDIFALASRVTADGDRDGLPNVLMEAQSQRLACVATRVSAIPELILDGETGLLVPPGDRAALAGAIARLVADPALREALGAAGERRVRQAFGMAPGLDRLAAHFGLAGLSLPGASAA